MAIAIENPSTAAAVVDTGLAVESIIATITARDIEKANDKNSCQPAPDWMRDMWEQLDHHELE